MNEFDRNTDEIREENNELEDIARTDDVTETNEVKETAAQAENVQPAEIVQPVNEKPVWNGQPAGGQPVYRPSEYRPADYRSYEPVPQVQQNSGQISYTPVKTKQKKEKKAVTRGALIAVVAAMLVFSLLCGLGGAWLASRALSRNDMPSEQPPRAANSGTVEEPTTPMVIYRSVDDVTTSTGVTSGENLTYAQVAAMVKDSVVEINTEYTMTSRWFQYTTGGAGSGVIISADGYVITNAHVILAEDTGNLASSITVRLTDGQEYKAQVMGYDAEADIAILKIDATGLTAAQCGDSSKLAVGEELVIVGNPLGKLGGTVTNGIVSATEREIQVSGVKMKLIQTNAAVNPGNSGGGMFNMKGHLVGIVNAKSSGTGVEGLGFAIPINDALNVSEQLMEYGYVRGKPFIGVNFTTVENSYGSSFFFNYYNVKPGLYIDSLTEGLNDDVLQVGDRVVSINDTAVSTLAEEKAIVSSSKVGDKLAFQVERDGKLTTVEVEVFEQPANTGTSGNLQFEEEQPKDGQSGGSFGEGGRSFEDMLPYFFDEFFGN